MLSSCTSSLKMKEERKRLAVHLDVVAPYGHADLSQVFEQ